MGKLYTSYYTKIKNGRANTVFVCISNTSPKWFIPPLERLKAFYPDWSKVDALRAGTISEDNFAIAYDDLLESRRSWLNSSCESIALWLKDKDVVLLCHEKTDRYCHRYRAAQVVASYLHLPYTVEELN